MICAVISEEHSSEDDRLARSIQHANFRREEFGDVREYEDFR